MKIGIFTETYRPTTNGVVVSIDTFKDELEKRGHTYYIFAPENPAQTKKESRIYRFPSFVPPNGAFYPLAQPMPYARAQHYLPLNIIKELDIIHIQHFSMMGQYGIDVAKQYNIPVVYTYHTMAELYTGYAGIFSPLIAAPIRARTRAFAKQADHVIVPTRSIKHYLESIGVQRAISIIPTGIHTALYKRTPKAFLAHRYNIPVNRDVLLFVGRLAKEKNISLLLKAFQQIVLALPETHLVIVGDGPDRQKFEAFVNQKGLSSHVTFTGFLDRPTTISLFGTADIFAFPSYTETQGIVVVEAMAAGAVPVAVDRLGPHDLIQDNKTGFLVDLSLDDFSGTIINLLHHQEKLLTVARTARQGAKSFDVSVTADAMEKLYERLITTAHHSRS